MVGANFYAFCNYGCCLFAQAAGPCTLVQICILATNILLRNASMSYKPNDTFLLTRTKFRRLDFFVMKLLIHTSRKEIIFTKTTLWLMQFSQSAKILLLVLGLQNTRISSSQYSSRSALKCSGNSNNIVFRYFKF